MRLALTPRQRTMLLFLSASGYTAWFAGLGERTSAESLATRAAPSVTVDARPDLPNVASQIVRDPFAGKPQTGAAKTAPYAQQTGATPLADPVVVPDIANRAGATVSELTLVLRATIVGPNPVAYVANGTAMDIVRVGDSLGERRVATIDLRGIAFSDGTRLDLPDSYVPTPQPVRRRGANDDRITLEALRHLLLPAKPQQPANPSDEATQGTPQPAASVTFPTPGPLPTVDMQGLPVGVNPTPDPSGPTPFPNPYPYAPPTHRQ